MKKFSKITSVIILFLAAISCQKQDLLLKDPAATEFALSKQGRTTSATVACDVVQLIFFKPYYNYRVGAYMYDTIINTFNYYPWGGPKSITTSHPTTGNEEHAFEYDNKKRLTKRIIYYRDQSNWSAYVKFVNGANDLITSDSLYVRWSSGVHMYTDYFYDNQQRIIKKVFTAPGAYTTVKEFNYDANGNLLQEGRVYDNKTSIKRTNPIWMFLDQDYSVNNGLYSRFQYNITYNSRGLPVTIFGVQNDPYISMPTLIGKQFNKVVYDCKGKPEIKVN